MPGLFFVLGDHMEILHDITDYPPFNTLGDSMFKNIIKADFEYTKIMPYTLISEKNQKINQIGYICSGNIDFLSDTENGYMIRKGSIGKGDYFGIESLFNSGLALFDELTTEPVECFTIEKEEFVKIIGRHSGLKHFFENILYEKLKKYLCDPFSKMQPSQDLNYNKESIRINKSIAYIDSNYMMCITLDDIARVAGLSRFHFSRIFKLATGHTFKDYLNMKRLKAAKKLLKLPEINISQACYSVGFNDVSYFSRTFKKYEGINPSYYRKKELEKSYLGDKCCNRLNQGEKHFINAITGRAVAS